MMFRTSATLLLALVLPGQLRGQSHTADSLAILELVRQRAAAMSAGQAALQRALFASDAVWINAFGTRRTGPDSIVAFLGRLYADPGYRASRLVREDPPEILFIRPDVAVVHEYHEREGQRLRDGRSINRRIHTTFVVSKEAGRWVVRYQRIGDERDRTPAP